MIKFPYKGIKYLYISKFICSSGIIDDESDGPECESCSLLSLGNIIQLFKSFYYKIKIIIVSIPKGCWKH